VPFFFLSVSAHTLLSIKKEKRIFLHSFLTINMSTSKECVFVTAATRLIGNDVVRDLVKKGIDTTAYVRDEHKAKDLFKE
jgi:hypothetical protein